MRGKLINLALLLGSLFFAFFIAELALRYMLFSGSEAFDSLREPSAYAWYPVDKDEDFFNEDYWKLVHRFTNKVNVEHPHPILGWTGRFSKETLRHSDEAFLGGRRPVLLYGDSFAQCVDTTQCFEDILNHDSEFSAGNYMLNYGVGGYGLDQICLLFEKTYSKYEDPFIIFSLLSTDMDRSMLAFRDSNKPHFELVNGTLELKGTPLTLSTDEYVKKYPPRIKSYLFNRFRKSKLNPFKYKPGKREARYIKEIKSLNGLILNRVLDSLESCGLDYVILIFNPEDHQLPDWRLSFLTRLCESRDVPFIIDRDLRLLDDTYENYLPDRYAIVGDGHPSTYMNRLVARELKNYVLGSGYGEEALRRNRDRWSIDVKYYRDRIRNTPEWFEQVRIKAEKLGITPDSMLSLDAIYMVNKYGTSQSVD